MQYYTPAILELAGFRLHPLHMTQYRAVLCDAVLHPSNLGVSRVQRQPYSPAGGHAAGCRQFPGHPCGHVADRQERPQASERKDNKKRKLHAGRRFHTDPSATMMALCKATSLIVCKTALYMHLHALQAALGLLIKSHSTFIQCSIQVQGGVTRHHS